MRNYKRYFLITMGMMIAGLALQSHAQDTMPHHNKALANLSWLAGTWVGNHEGDYLEEIWSEPVGDTMMGVFRWVKGGKVWINEIVTITADTEGLVFRLRHFDKKMTAWEEKDKPFYYPMISAAPYEIVFENPERDHPRRITYRRVEDKLHIILDGVSEDKKPSTTEFLFHKK